MNPERIHERKSARRPAGLKPLGDPADLKPLGDPTDLKSGVKKMS